MLQWLPWQGLFLAGAPLAAVLAVLVARMAPPGERHAADLDLPGTCVLTAAPFALLFGIIEGPERGWASLLVVGGFACSAVLLAVFAVNAQYLQYAQGYSPLLTGVAIAPLVIGMVVMSKRSVGLAERFGGRPVFVAGMITLAAGLGSGLNSAAREIGSALGVAVIGTVLTGRFAEALPPVLNEHAHSAGEAMAVVDPGARRGRAQVIEAFTGAMSAGFRVVAVVVAVGAVLVALGLPRRER